MQSCITQCAQFQTGDGKQDRFCADALTSNSLPDLLLVSAPLQPVLLPVALYDILHPGANTENINLELSFCKEFQSRHTFVSHNMLALFYKRLSDLID